MKKVLLLAAALLLLAPPAMAGMTAFMDMDELSSSELADTTGQAGITIRGTITVVSSGFIAWGDDDGCTNTITSTNQGWLTLATIAQSVTTTGSGIEIDVCGSYAGDQYLVITLPGLTMTQTIRAIKVGSTINTDDSMGELRIVDLVLTGTTIAVRGH
jgi:hypothetical protein